MFRQKLLFKKSKLVWRKKTNRAHKYFVTFFENRNNKHRHLSNAIDRIEKKDDSFFKKKISTPTLEKMRDHPGSAPLLK